MLQNTEQQIQREQNLRRVNQVIGILSSDTRNPSQFKCNALVYGLSAGIGLGLTTWHCIETHHSYYLPGDPINFNATLSMELRQECIEQKFGIFTAGSLFFLMFVWRLCNNFQSSRGGQDLPPNRNVLPQGNQALQADEQIANNLGV